jgi:hypothetical protein
MMLQKVCLRGLLISAIVYLVLCAAQGWSGNWSVFYFVWPGSDTSAGFTRFVVDLTNYHLKMGFAIGAVSILIIIFAFLGKTNIYVRIFAILGLVVTVTAAVGGYLYVHSAFVDRLALGQMADAFIGALAAYFLMLLFLYKTPNFPWSRKR